MKPLVILFIIIFYFIFKIYYKKKNKMISPDEYDIIYNPGSYFGFYTLGIGHYVKNNFDISNKKTVGISAGSWLSIFMNLNKIDSNKFIKQLFKKIHYTYPLHKLPKLLEKTLYDVKGENINISNINIMVSNMNDYTLDVHSNFLSLNDAVRCCMASSFIPLITYKDIFYFYKNKSTLDGMLFKKFYLKKVNTEKTLVIKFDMFGRFTKNKTYKSNFNPGRSLYDLYILGYRDAVKNHSYFTKYLNVINK
jgi:hypothetical protein